MTRRIHSIVLLLALLIGGAGMNYVQAATHSGNCGANGNNVIWSLNTSTGVLTISGSGAMKDFVSSSGAPWYLDRMSITSVTIANGVTTIGNYAFYACVKLSSVAIPSSVTSIGNSGFSSCTKLTSVNIPNSVTNIGIYAFNHCSSLISVNIPNGVTSIGEFTFNGCSSLTSMTIPNSVASIGVSAFRDCSALTDVYASWTGDAVPTMPSNIHNFEASQIRLHIPCGQAGTYFAKGWNTKFTIDGVVSGTCGAQGDNLTWSLSCDGTLTISGSGAMADWSSSDKVPWYSYRSSITTVNIRDGVTSVGNRAFIDCAVLTSVTIPNSVTSISNNAFFSCSALTGIAIPNSVTTIGQYVFYGCSALTNITIPGSVTSLGESIFKNCSALTDIYVSWIGTDILELPTNIHNSASEIKLHIPCGTAADYASKNWSTMFTLNEGSVSGTCGANGDNLTWSLFCGGTLTISGTGAMVHYWAYEDIPWWNYRGSIQRIVIEEGVTTIGNHAFVQCSNLTYVSLPNTLTAISYLAFGHCTSLPSLVIPSSVTSMAGMFIHNTPALKDVYVSWQDDAVPDMPADIHTYDASEKRLHIPCGQTAAYVAKGWNTKFTIEEGASGSCGTNVQWHFDPCTGVLSLSGTGAMTDYSYGEAPPWSVFRTSITSVSIANGITRIGACAFNGCYWITSISIPNSVTSIGYSAFDGCTSLASISIPNSVTDIGHDAFYGCRALTSIVIPNSVTDIGYHAFYECTSLASVSLSNNLTSISTYTFYNCSSLTSITIPNSITSIGSTAFYNCSSLTSITIPNSVTSIGSRAFYNCSSLTSIIIPNGVTSIGLRAFERCTHLTTVYIPSSVTSIGMYAFYGCNSLTDLYVSWTTTATIPNWNSMNNKTPRSSIRLHVPCGTTAQYQAKSIWKSCTIVEEAQGDCGADGENLRWALTCDGKRLTIYGTGAMRHFWTYETDIPWWSARGTIQELVIKEGVTTIGNHAFVTCSALTSVYLPNTLTAISYLAFGHCTSLPSLVIPSSVTSMAGMFIHNTASLTDVYASWTGDAVPDMPADLHPYDASQKRLHIPCGQEAAYTAKGWNTKFTYVTMFSGTCGTNVQWTLDHCTGVLTISGTGAMTDYSNESEAPWRWWRESITSVIIQNGVTRIGDNAFYNCANITSMTVPPSITSFGMDAFFSSWAMESLYITDLTAWCNISFSSYTSSPFYRNGRTEITHGGNCYVNGTQVTTLTIPNGITEIPNHTFSGFANITSIQFNQATSIGGFAFAACHGLTHVTIPEGVTTIGNNAFAYCTNLQSIFVPASVTSLGTDVLYNSLALTDIYVHWTENIPSWGSFTSKNPQSDITLHVPCGTAALYQAAEGWQDYTIVEDRAHGTCGANGDNLTWTLSCDGTLTISGTGAMYNWMTLADRPWHSLCTSIQRVVIEEGVTTTGFHAFYGASNLTSVSLPSTLQTLQFMTFFDCGKLTTLTIPSSVTYVGTRSLEGCAALTDVYMSETGDAVPTMPVRIHTYDASRITLHIPCGQAGAYFAKSWNTKFTIDGVVSGTCGDNVQWTFESCNGTLSIFGTGPMANYAYTNQVPWYSFRESITSVTIANGVTTIGQPAFYNCSNLTSVSIGTGVTTICRQAFQNCTNLPSITIGDHVTTIERKAFDNCSGLTSITIPPSVTSIGEEAFNGCYAMESLYITDLTAWCNISFDGIYATPFIRNGYASYRGGGNLFLNGVQVTTLTIPDGVTEIKHYTFYGFAGITDVQFNQVTTIGRSAFNSNHGLTDITIPEGVTIINPNAFNYCTSLQSISIPESVTAIGNRALRTTALTDIYVYWTGNIPAWDELTNKYPQSDITLHVPCSAMSLYKAAEGWKDYHIEGEGGPYTITVESDDPSMGTVDARKIEE